MVEINLDIIQAKQEICSLEKKCFEERIEDLKTNLFSEALIVKENEKGLKATFTYSKKILQGITDFVNFENSCCGDFTVEIKVDMKNQSLMLDIVI